ncbi:MAG: hypothetical protein OXK76_06410 [Gammaproteobacteria bacterium]|nr:hypothetical protein [Gammaproteobacteria bacterium]
MTRYARHTGTVLAVWIAIAAGHIGQGAESATNAEAAPSSPAAPRTRMLVVTGLGGEAEYARAFEAQGEASARNAEAPGTEVTLLTEGDATREAIRDALVGIVKQSAKADAVIVQLYGHGTFDGEHYRFNVPGPDPTAADLAAWLAPVAARRQLVVIATSASGAAQEPLHQEGRTVITATRHGRERDASLFGGFWTDALDAPGADIDKDRRISAEEAFRFAERAVAGFYEDQQLMVTEHPRLEGDAGLFIVGRIAPSERVEPGVVHLASRVEELTNAIDALKADRRVLTDDDYFARLQDLLMELATVDQQLKAHQQDPDEVDAAFREDVDR